MSVPNASAVLRDTGGCLTLLLLGGSSERKERGPISSCQIISLLPQPSPLAFPQAAEHLCLPRRSPALFNFSGCGHLLVLGGCAKPGSHLNSGELLDTELPGSKGWELVSNFGCELEGFSCAAFCQLENDSFVFGGYDGQQCMNQVLQVESAEPHKITRLTPLPFGLKNSAAIPALDSRTIWLVGGWDGRRTLTTILEYDVAQQSCRIKGLLPYPLEGHVVAFSQLCQLAFIVGGFDSVGLRSEVLAMDPRSGKVLGETGASLRRARENCVAICYGDGSAEWLAVIGGWDGHRTLGDWELFEVLPASPWLRRADDQMLANLEKSMMVVRNRPAAILFHSKSRPEKSTMTLASEDIVK